MSPQSNPEQLVEAWEAMSCTYLPERSALVGATAEHLVAECGQAPRILDLGGGPGTVARALATAVPGSAVVVVDADSVLAHLGLRTAHPWVEFRFTDFATADWSAFGEFDAVLAVLTLHYFDDTTTAELLTGLRRFVVDSGRIVTLDVFRTPSRPADPLAWQQWWRAARASTDPGVRAAMAERIEIPSAECHRSIRRHVELARSAGFTGPVRVLARHGAAAAVSIRCTTART